MLKKITLSLAATTILCATPGAALIDLYTVIEQTEESAPNAGEVVNYTITYGNRGDTAANNPFVNILFPSNVPAPLDEITEADLSAIEDSVSSALGVPLIFLDSTFCDSIIFQVQCDTDNEGDRPCPFDGLTAGAEGSFTYDITMPDELPSSPTFEVTAPQSIAGLWQFVPSACGDTEGLDSCGEGDCFGPRPSSWADSVLTQLELVNDGSGTTGSQGCTALEGFTAGNIAVVDRGTCEFGLKAFYAQEAGASGVIVVNNEIPSSDETILMRGGDFGSTTTIPVIMISQNQGEALKAELGNGVTASIGNQLSSTITWNATIFTVPTEEDSDPTNDSSSLSTTIKNLPPRAAFDFVAASLTVDFTDTSIGGPSSWSWNFGDGNSSTEQNPSNSYLDEGSYAVTLTVMNDGGSDTTSMEITVEEDDTTPILDELYFYPAAAKAEGAESSFFLTDATINNSGSAMASYSFGWLPRGTDNSDPMMSDVFTLDAGRSVVYSDVLGAAFGLDDGAVGALMVASDSIDLLLMSRTYNQLADKAGGTFGQSFAGIAVADLIPADSRVRILFFVENDAFRSNLGLMNGTGTDITIKWERFLTDGTSVETGFTNLPAWGNAQINTVFAAEAPVNGGYVDVWTETTDGVFATYGSLLDNQTSDPTTVLPQ